MTRTRLKLMVGGFGLGLGAVAAVADVPAGCAPKTTAHTVAKMVPAEPPVKVEPPKPSDLPVPTLPAMPPSPAAIPVIPPPAPVAAPAPPPPTLPSPTVPEVAKIEPPAMLPPTASVPFSANVKTNGEVRMDPPALPAPVAAPLPVIPGGQVLVPAPAPPAPARTEPQPSPVPTGFHSRFSPNPGENPTPGFNFSATTPPAPTREVTKGYDPTAVSFKPDPVVESPKPAPVTPAAAVEPAKELERKLKVILHMGDGRPRFEVRDGEEVYLKIASDRVDVKSPTEKDAKGAPAIMRASGAVRFVTPGGEGTCNELTVHPGTGLVTVSGGVKFTYNWGQVQTTVGGEQMTFRLGSMPGAAPAQVSSRLE